MSIESELQDKPGLLVGAITGFCIFLWWLFQKAVGFVTGSITAQQKQIDDIRRDLDRNYVPRPEIVEREDKLNAKIDRVWDKLDEIHNELRRSR